MIYKIQQVNPEELQTSANRDVLDHPKEDLVDLYLHQSREFKDANHIIL